MSDWVKGDEPESLARKVYWAAKWHWYYQIVRRVQKAPLRLARRLPRWLKYWVLIDVGARYTASPGWKPDKVQHPMSAPLGAMLDFEHNRRPWKNH